MYADNKQSDYTTLLSAPLELDGNWQVALNELSFKPSFNSQLGTIHIDSNDLNCIQKNLKKTSFV